MKFVFIKMKSISSTASDSLRLKIQKMTAMSYFSLEERILQTKFKLIT
jgi:hypothetical protein